MALIKNKYSTGDILTAVDMNEIVGQVIDNGDNLSKKVDINQGTQNAGKALVINEQGQVTVGIAAQPVDKTLKNDGEAADAKVVGDTLVGMSNAIVDVNNDLVEYKEAVQLAFDNVYKDIYADIGVMSQLNTTDKSSLVAAINEAAESSGTDGKLIMVQDTQPTEDVPCKLWIKQGTAEQVQIPTMEAFEEFENSIAGFDDHVADTAIHVTPADKSRWDTIPPVRVGFDASGRFCLITKEE